MAFFWETLILNDFFEKYDLKNIRETWVDGDPNSLTSIQAEGIRLYKRQTTFRQLARDLLGQEFQMLGTWLSRDAARKLLGKSLEELFEMEYDENDPIHREHSHVIGSFFWWT